MEFEEASYNYLYFSDLKNAKKMIDEAIKLDANRPELKLVLGKILVASKDHQMAIDTLEGLNLSGDSSDERNLYLGIGYLGVDNKEKAKSFFEMAKANPKFATQAANYLNAMQVSNKKLRVSADFGLNYDSRIIDEDLLSTTDGAGGRLFFSSDVSYMVKEFKAAKLSVGADITTLYSFDDDVSLGDPLVFTLNAPYSRKIKMFGKSQDFVFDTQIQQIWLDIDNDGTKEDLMRSVVLKGDALEEKVGDRALGYNAEIRYDDGIDESVKEGTNEVTGLGLRLGADWHQFRSSTDIKQWTASAYLRFGFANGENMKYQRLGLNYIYFMNKWGFNLGLLGALRYTAYPDYVVDRSDTYFSVGTVATKPLKDWVNQDWAKFFLVEFKASFTLNESELDVRDYNRFIVSSLLKGQWSF